MNAKYKKKTKDLLQYEVEPDDVAMICEADRNHGRICKILRKWDGSPVMSITFSELKGKDCFVVMSLGSPFVHEQYLDGIYYSMNKTHLLVVESRHLKRMAHFSKVDWKFWNAK